MSPCVHTEHSPFRELSHCLPLMLTTILCGEAVAGMTIPVFQNWKKMSDFTKAMCLASFGAGVEARFFPVQVTPLVLFLFQDPDQLHSGHRFHSLQW